MISLEAHRSGKRPIKRRDGRRIVWGPHLIDTASGPWMVYGYQLGDKVHQCHVDLRGRYQGQSNAEDGADLIQEDVWVYRIQLLNGTVGQALSHEELSLARATNRGPRLVYRHRPGDTHISKWEEVTGDEI